MKSVIKLEEGYTGYAPNLFSLPNHYEKCVSSVLIPYGFIKDRVEKLAEEIAEVYAEEEFVVCVCVLKGAFRFYTDLVQHLKNAIRHANRPTILDFEFIQLSSYRNDENTGTVNFISAKSIFKNFTGKNVLIVEDIVESGATMMQLVDALGEYNCKSIKSVSLLIKSKKSVCPYMPDFVGFDVPDKFVIGYGLDYNEVFRDMDHICEISKEGLDRYRVKEEQK